MTKQASNIVAGDEVVVVESPRRELSAQAEAELVLRAQAGQVEAFGQLVLAHQDRLYNVVYKLCSKPEVAEDLAQEAFLKAFEKLDKFRGGSRFYTWLFRIATNLALSYRRRLVRVKFHSLQARTGADKEPNASLADIRTAELAKSRNPGPEAVAIAREDALKVHQALDELDEEFRTVVILRDTEDMSYDEISEILEIPHGTVKSRLHRARKILKEKLSDLVKMK